MNPPPLTWTKATFHVPEHSPGKYGFRLVTDKIERVGALLRRASATSHGDHNPMGQHYVPQKYLSRFAEPAHPAMIWLYDKQGGSHRRVAIVRVAQSRAFYTAEDEAKLASTIEGPANPVIEKLIRRESLSNIDRARISLYVAVMLRRVPYRRRRIYETIVPPVLRDILAEIRTEVVAAAETAALDPERVSAFLAKLEESEEHLVNNPPERIHETVRQPWPTREMVTVIYNMAWRILETSGPISYITTDNPAFYFEDYGLGTERSELTFPLSTTHCLHGCWQGPTAGLAFLEAAQSFVKEANRRVASTAERFGFYHQSADWVQPLLQKRRPYLSRIQW